MAVSIKALKVIVMTAFAILITGCATLFPPDPWIAVTPKPNEPVAYLVGTLAIKTEGDDALTNGRYSLLFRAAGAKESLRLTYTQSEFSRSPETAFESP